MSKFILGLGGVMAVSTGTVATADASADPKLVDLLNAVQGQHIVRDIRLPTQESMSFDQLRLTGSAYNQLTAALNDGGDVDKAAETVLTTLKGVKRINNPLDLDALKDRIITTAEDRGTFYPGLADRQLEETYGWHSGTRAMTCFHEPSRNP